MMSSFYTVHKLNENNEERTTESVQQHVVYKMQSTLNSLKSEIRILRVRARGLVCQQKAQREMVTKMLLSEGLTDIVNKSFTEQVAYLLEERARLLEEVKMMQGKNRQELLYQKENNIQQQNNMVILEQEILKVAAELKMTQSRLEQLEKKDKSSAAELQISGQRNKELEQQLKTVSAELQNEKALNLQHQQKEIASIRTKTDALGNELIKHKTQWEDKSFILSKHQEELVAIRAQIPAMDEEIKDLMKIIATRKPKLEDTQMTWVQPTEKMALAEDPSTFNIQEAKQICQGIIQTLQKKLDSNQQENESLRTELIRTLTTLGTQTREFDKKEFHYKEKLCKLKDVYLKETAWRDDKVKELERELRFLTLRFEKERVIVQNMRNENETLLRAYIWLEIRLSDHH